MPRILAIETSGRVGSIALAEGGLTVSEEQFPHGLKHAAEIVPMIDRLCRARGWTPRDIERLYVSVGPGSFTGLRIGVTFAKTLALATGVRLVAVPSLRVLAENAPTAAVHVIPVLDAKRDQVFTARFERVGDAWAERESPRIDSLAPMIARSPKPVYLLGEGIPFHAKFIPSNADVIMTAEECWRARAAAVVRIGDVMADSGQFTEPDQLNPIYIRKPEAEEKWEASQPAAGVIT